ncbi:MAG: antiviral reverse transcriptase Drt3a [Bacteroidota bacterium]
MYDQSFNAKSFQEIFDIENRKGNNVESRFKIDFSESLAKLNQIKTISEKLKVELDKDERIKLLKDKSTLKKQRSELIAEVLEKASNKIKKHKIILEEGDDFGGQSYVLENNIENFFISKKTQLNINKLYDVKQSSRHSILNELLVQLEDKFPKYVLRTDIKKFYESIPQKQLLSKINDDYLLSIQTKEYITQILKAYREITNQPDLNTAKGIPRGVGVSAFLAELFMRKIDNNIRNLDDLVYYCRYVDDIIIIFIPEKIDNDNNPLDKILNQIKALINEYAGNEFLINEEKTKKYSLTEGLKNLAFEKQVYLDDVLILKVPILNSKPITFLGYKIGSVNKEHGTTQLGGTIKTKPSNVFSVDISENKLIKYKTRIKLMFSDFKKKAFPTIKDFKLLEARIRFLTSNTKLRNSKNCVFVGIYYSNIFVNNFNSLETLDKSLHYHINRSGLDTSKKNSLKKYSFKDGFIGKKFEIIPLQNRTYLNHNKKKLDSNNSRNKGILKHGLAEINSIWK